MVYNKGADKNSKSRKQEENKPKLVEGNKAIGYCRVSTIGQAEEGKRKMDFPQKVNYKDYKIEIEKAIRNLNNLPSGLKCSYLLTIKGQDNTLVAKQWKRKSPKVLSNNEVLIRF